MHGRAAGRFSQRHVTVLPTNRVRQLTDAPMIRNIDAREWTQEIIAYAAVRGRLKLMTKNALLSPRINEDLIEWFKEQGSGHQSRANALPCAYMEAYRYRLPIFPKDLNANA